MTENKRFILADIGFVYDNEKLIGMKYIVEVMNALYDENQLLHKINEDTIDFMYDNFDLNIIFTDRELNDIKELLKYSCEEMEW